MSATEPCPRCNARVVDVEIPPLQAFDLADDDEMPVVYRCEEAHVWTTGAWSKRKRPIRMSLFRMRRPA